MLIRTEIVGKSTLHPYLLKMWFFLLKDILLDYLKDILLDYVEWIISE